MADSNANFVAITPRAARKIADTVRTVSQMPTDARGTPNPFTSTSPVILWGTVTAAPSSNQVTLQPCKGPKDDTAKTKSDGSNVPTVTVYVSLPLQPTGSKNQRPLTAKTGEVLGYRQIGLEESGSPIYLLYEPPIGMLVPVTLSQDGGSDGGWNTTGGNFTFPTYTYTATNAQTHVSLGTNLSPQMRLFPGSCNAAGYGFGFMGVDGTTFTLLLVNETPNVNPCDSYDGDTGTGGTGG